MKRALALLLLLAAGCGKPTAELRLIFTCDARGRLEPCGCFDGQMGGLTRIYTLIGDQPLENELRVDVGDAIAGTEDFHHIKYTYMLKAFDRMGYAAMNMGLGEAGLSPTLLKQLREQSPVPMISANLLDRKSGQPVLEPWRIVERADRKIGLIGLIDPELSPEKIHPELRVGALDGPFRDALNALTPQVDLVVLLAFANESRLKAIAREFYECDVILGGAVSQPSQEVEQENKSLILYVTNQARALGELWLQLKGESEPEYLHHDVKLVHHKIDEAQPMIDLASAYKQEIRETELAIDQPEQLQKGWVPGVQLKSTYVGSDACMGCHPTAFNTWKTSHHAKAFETLIEANADADPDCIRCHTVGFGRPDGYRREFAAKKLVDVGCESCHGPGSLHINQKAGGVDNGFRFRPLAAGDCQKCHYGEFSRPFHWEQFWPLIEHGLEGP
ncbi:MAG: multiheme c-type cytochrome [Verrucomicrobiota bacterium]